MLPHSLATVDTVVTYLAFSQPLAPVVTFNVVALVASYRAALVPSPFNMKGYCFCCAFSLLSYCQDPALVQILFLLGQTLVTAKFCSIWCFRIQPDISISIDRCNWNTRFMRDRWYLGVQRFMQELDTFFFFFFAVSSGNDLSSPKSENFH